MKFRETCLPIILCQQKFAGIIWTGLFFGCLQTPDVLCEEPTHDLSKSIMEKRITLSDDRSKQVDDEALSPYIATLKKHGIDPGEEGLRQYLRQLHPEKRQRLKIAQLIRQLGSERFAKREAAMKQLLGLPVPPIVALRTAAENQDEEISYRAKTLLARLKPQQSLQKVLMFSVFKTIKANKIQGLTSELLNVIEHCDRPHLLIAIRKAIRATAKPGDEEALRQATKSNNQQVVIAAIGGLGTTVGDDARDELQKILEHPNEAFRLASAQALADLGDRASLKILLDLLDSPSLEIRVDAVKTLRQLSHMHHHYAAYEDKMSRKEAVERWSTWVNNEGPSATLHFPLQSVWLERGRTLISMPGQNKVIELDSNGEKVWEKKGLKSPWAGMGLANGHRLISSQGGCIEFDASGAEVWRKDVVSENPHDSRRLENGNTLIACYGSKKLVEIRPDRSTAWEVTVSDAPVELRRLNTSKTMVTLYGSGKVVEVDRKGKVLWQIKNLNKPMTAQRLENGNTLVAEYGGGRVVELDRASKTVWQYRGLKKAYSAERLSNGNTLIACLTDLREVDCLGNIIWQKKISGMYHAVRY